jgi:DNA-binding NarL/FixJ family response regulator
MSKKLTAREREVLRHIAAGHQNKEICRRLGVELGTVKAHARQIYLKIGATNRAHAAAIAVQRGVA